MTVSLPTRTLQEPRLPDSADLLAAVAAGVVVLDRSGGVVGANGAARRLLAGRPIGALVAALAGQAEGFQPPGGTGGPLRLSRRELPGGGHVVTLWEATPEADALRRAARDPLTGLETRTALREAISRLLAERAPMALYCVDLDRFKAVNDTLGHPAGDALLRKVAQRLRAGVRAGDIVARMGGDEFAILQAGHGGPAAAEAQAARLVDLVGRAYVVEGHAVHIGASIGIALWDGEGPAAPDPGLLHRRADLALYHAKAAGRGTYRSFEPGMDARLHQRRAIELDLRKALALGELRLAYQPQVDVADGRVTGFEALLRWDHPTRGEVSAGEFVPLAEEVGLIVPIGEWVVATACRQAATWPAEIGLAVNLSPLQFRSPALVAQVAAALDASGLDPGRLELEVTEGALIEDAALALDVLHRLKAMGVKVSMDDFGTGYSSLATLQSFPFDRIKIDQSFVRGADTRDGDGAIVRAIAGLGRSLGIRTTAEGVETEAQLDRVRREGCTDVQGYYTGRPLPPEAVATLLATPTPAVPAAAATPPGSPP